MDGTFPSPAPPEKAGGKAVVALLRGLAGEPMPLGLLQAPGGWAVVPEIDLLIFQKKVEFWILE